MGKVEYSLSPELFEVAKRAKRFETYDDFRKAVLKGIPPDHQADRILKLRINLEASGFKNLEDFYEICRKSEMKDMSKVDTVTGWIVRVVAIMVVGGLGFFIAWLMYSS